MKRLGFTVDEIRGLTMPQVQFWLEAMAYGMELMAESTKETRSLDDLVKILPKEEKKT